MYPVALALWLLFAPAASAKSEPAELARIVFRSRDPERLRAVATGFPRVGQNDWFEYAPLDRIPGVVFDAIRDHLNVSGHAERWDELTWASRTEDFDLALSTSSRGLVDLGRLQIVVGFLVLTVDVHSTSILALERVMHLARRALGAYARMNVAHHAHTCLPFSAQCLVRSPVFRWITVPAPLTMIEDAAAPTTLAAQSTFTLAHESGRRVVDFPALRDGDPVLVEWADESSRPRRIEFIRGVGLFDSMFSPLKQSPSDEIFGNFPWEFDGPGLENYREHFEELSGREDASPESTAYARVGLSTIERIRRCQTHLELEDEGH